MGIDERLGRIEEQLESLRHSLIGNGRPGVIPEHEQRIKALEMWQRSIAAVLAFLMAVAGLWASASK